jgi:septum formation protein
MTDKPLPRVVLASASPRRKELLSLILKEYEVIPSRYDESLTPIELGPEEHVLYSSRMKALDLVNQAEERIIISADTVVTIDDLILGKPTDAVDAERMLRMLSGRMHRVMTGITVIRDGKRKSGLESTGVLFRHLDDNLIRRYIQTGEPMDKAGAYAIQGRGCVLVTGIQGCYFNVVGLPLFRLSRMLESFGISPIADFELTQS